MAQTPHPACPSACLAEKGGSRPPSRAGSVGDLEAASICSTGRSTGGTGDHDDYDTEELVDDPFAVAVEQVARWLFAGCQACLVLELRSPFSWPCPDISIPHDTTMPCDQCWQQLYEKRASTREAGLATLVRLLAADVQYDECMLRVATFSQVCAIFVCLCAYEPMRGANEAAVCIHTPHGGLVQAASAAGAAARDPPCLFRALPFPRPAQMFLGSIKRGGPAEAALAARALALHVVTLGAGDEAESIYRDALPVLEPVRVHGRMGGWACCCCSCRR